MYSKKKISLPMYSKKKRLQKMKQKMTQAVPKTIMVKRKKNQQMRKPGNMGKRKMKKEQTKT